MLPASSGRAITWLVALLGMTACGIRPQATTSVDPLFAPRETRTVAVVPFFEWQLSLDDTRAMNEHLLEVLRQRGPDLTLITPDEASDLLKAAGLPYDWALYLNDERQGSTPDSTIIMRMADALGADLIAHVRFVEAFQHDGSADIGAPFSTVIMELRLFSGRTGGIRWRSESGVEQVEIVGREAPSIDSVARSIFDTIAAELPQFGTHS